LQPARLEAIQHNKHAVHGRFVVEREGLGRCVRVAAALTLTGAMGAVSQAGDQVQSVKTTLTTVKEITVETFGVPPSAALPVVMVLAGGVILWRRFRQRAQGQA